MSETADQFAERDAIEAESRRGIEPENDEDALPAADDDDAGREQPDPPAVGQPGG